MKILIEAYSCAPGEGSEKGVGWNVIRLLIQEFGHHVVVITRSKNREKIELTDLGNHKSIKWIYVDPSGFFLWLKKRGGLGLRVFNLIWQRKMRRAAQNYLACHDVDLLHRLTFGSILPPSLLSDFDKPLLVGPASGAEMTAPELSSTLPLRLRCKDRLRAMVFDLLLALPSTKKRYRKCSVALGATSASVAAFEKLGVREVRQLAQSGCGGDEVEGFARSVSQTKRGREGPVRLVTACRLVHWKGVDLAIDAVSLAVHQGEDVLMTVLEDGPERGRLEAKVARLGLEDRVHFAGRLPALEDVYGVISESDALIHPALNEAFGQAVLESLVLGRQVICLDWAGPGMIVDHTCGLKVLPGPRSEVVSALAVAIRALPSRREQWSEIEKNARERAKKFSWLQLVGEINKAYHFALEQRETQKK